MGREGGDERRREEMREGGRREGGRREGEGKGRGSMVTLVSYILELSLGAPNKQ